MSRRWPRPGWLATAALIAAVCAGCASIDDQAHAVAQRALVFATPTPAPTPSPTRTASPPPCDLSESLRPLAPLPQPGNMPAGVLQTIQQRGYLIAAVDLNTLLLSYADPRTGQLQGFEIDLLGRIAHAIFGDDADRRIKFVGVTTGQRDGVVEQGTVDLVADAFTITCLRKTEFGFSAPYYTAQQRLLVPTTSSAQGIDDLKGRTICATKGSTSIGLIAEHGAIPDGVPTRIDCLVHLQENKADAITSDDTILAGFQAQDPFTKIVGPSLGAQPYGIAVNASDPQLERFVNGVLEQLRSSGEWTALYARWLEPYMRVPGQQPVADYRG